MLNQKRRLNLAPLEFSPVGGLRPVNQDFQLRAGKQRIETAGCRLLYLPPYSPDFNRIETCWAWLKSRIRKRLSQSDSLRQAVESVLKDAVS